MARSSKRYMVYPAGRAIEVIGGTAPALNQALECWAALLARATADNAKTLGGPQEEYVSGSGLQVKHLHDWGVLADVLKEMRFDPEFASPGMLLATAVEDAHRLEDVGDKWFSGESISESDTTDAAIRHLALKLRGLDYEHSWAVITAVQWFWERKETIRLDKDPWWTLAFRRQWIQKHSGTSRPNEVGKKLTTRRNKAE